MQNKKIVYKNINDIKEYENNPRINDRAVDKVAESIKSFNFQNPIIIDVNNVIVAGHTRVRAARQLGIDTVPCIVADDLTDAQIKAFRLADNKTGEFALWDIDKMDAELAELADMNFDMSAFGFIVTGDDDDFDGDDLDKENEKSGGVQVTITFESYADYSCIESELKNLAETNNGAYVVRTV